MSCIQINISNSEGGIKASVLNVTEHITVKVSLLQDFPIIAEVNNVSDPIIVNIHTALSSEITIIEVSKRLNIYCSLVCAVTEVPPYIEISQEIIWLIPENDFSEDVLVQSNTDWIIE